MKWDKLETQWGDYAGCARAHWTKLTDADWQSMTGNKEQLVTRIQERYAIAHEDAEKQVDEWCGSMYGISRGQTWLAEYDKRTAYK